MMAGVEKGSSSSQSVSIGRHASRGVDPKELVAPCHAAPAEATYKYRKRQNIAQRQQPQPRHRQPENSRQRPGRSPPDPASQDEKPASERTHPRKDRD